MIQRIQTVYLFIVFCLMALLFYIPFSSSWAVLFAAGLAALLSLITIFLFKKRKLQIKTSYILLFLLALVYIIYFIFDQKSLLTTDFFLNTRLSFVFPLIAIILVYLAIRGIKKDENLVRSLDRLR